MLAIAFWILTASPLDAAHEALARGDLTRAADLAEAVRGPDERSALELVRAVSDARADGARAARVTARLSRLPAPPAALDPDPLPQGAPIVANAQAFVRVSRANVRESATASSRIVTVLPMNTAVNVRGLVREWAVIPGGELDDYVLASLLAPAPVSIDALVRRADELTKAGDPLGACIALERAFVAARDDPPRRAVLRGPLVTAALAARRYALAVEAVSPPPPAVLQALAPAEGDIPGEALWPVLGRDDGVEYVRTWHDDTRAWVRVAGRIVELPRVAVTGELGERDGARSALTFARDDLTVILQRTLWHVGQADDCRVLFYDVEIVVRAASGVQRIAARHQRGC